MTKDSDLEHDPFGEASFAGFMRKVGDLIEAREAVNPRPPPPPEPWVDKPGTLIAAEKEVFYLEIMEKLQPDLCGGLDKCARARCRRARLCAELEILKPVTEAARATLACEHAKWRPKLAPAEQSARRRRRAI